MITTADGDGVAADEKLGKGVLDGINVTAPITGGVGSISNPAEGMIGTVIGVTGASVGCTLTIGGNTELARDNGAV